MFLFVVLPAVVFHLPKALHPLQHRHHVAVSHARVAAGHGAGLVELGLVEFFLQPVDRLIGTVGGLRSGIVLFAGLDHARLDQRFQVAQRHRHHAVALELDDAEARRELGQRRILVGAHLQRKTLLVGELAPGVVGHVRGNLDHELHALGERPGETHFLDELGGIARIRQLGRIGLAGRRLEA